MIETISGNFSLIAIDYPECIRKETSSSGHVMSLRDYYEMLAKDLDKSDPPSAEFYRKVASCYSERDVNGYSVERDTKDRILIDCDDWDELSTEERLFRGNRNATIALLDRLRFNLETMDDEPYLMEELDDLRRGLDNLVEKSSFI